jgi:hypothetical protein
MSQHQPHTRYVYPGAPILVVAGLASIHRVNSDDRFRGRGTKVLILGMVAGVAFPPLTFLRLVHRC